MEHLFADPQIKHRNMIAEVPHPTIGTLRLTGAPIKYSDTPSSIRRHPPLLGEHTDEILAEALGYSKGKIKTLKADGAVV
jgi:crotonobetainyl-CoA:carnitine CoA-transferase CaiB-like acyl-CoA transferase